MRRPHGPGVPFCLGLAASILIARGSGLAPVAVATAGFAAASLALSVFWVSRHAQGPVPARGRAFALALAAGLASGAGLATPWPGRRFLGVRESSVRAFRGVAVEDARALDGGRLLHRVALSSAGTGEGDAWSPAHGTVRLVSRGGAPTYVGQQVEAHGRLAPLDWTDRDDWSSSVGPGGLAPGGIRSPLLRLRRSVRAWIDLRAREMGYPVSAFFMAMFLGERQGVSDELEGLFRDAGALHVLALSGTHLVLVYGLAALLARPLPWARLRRGLPLAVVAAYFAVVGALPSIARAAAMLVVARAARALDRSAGGLDLLGLAAGAVLLVEPRMLFDLSFQLSVCAVLGMVTLGAALAEAAAPVLPRALALPLSAGAGAQLAVSPVLLAASGLFQPVGLVSGLVVSPLATALLAAGLLDIALPLWVPAVLRGALGAAEYAAYRALEGALRFFAAFPSSRSWALAAALWAAALALLAPAIVRRARAGGGR